MELWKNRAENIANDSLLSETIRQYYQTSYRRYLKRTTRLLESLEGKSDNILETSIIDLDGIYLSSSNREQIKSRSAFFDPRRTKCQSHYIGLSLDKEHGLVARVHVPLFHGVNLLGYAEVIFSAAVMAKLTEDGTSLGKTGETGVLVATLDKGALFVLPLRHDQKAAFQRKVEAEKGDHPALQALYSKSSNPGNYIDYRGVEVLSANRYIPALGYGLVVKIDFSEALGPVETFAKGLLAFGLLATVVVLLIGFWMAGVITHPIQELSATAHSIQQGNFKHRATVNGQDELAQLGRSFNLMASALIDSNAALEERVTARTRDLDQANASLQRQKAELQRSNAELQSFASVASHDLQEPLRKIQAFGQRLVKAESENFSEQGKMYVDRMCNAADRMQTLIHDLLAFSRVTSKAKPFAVVNLDEVVAGVMSDLEIRILENDAKVNIAGLPEIDADQLQMRQLMQNLIGNALKYRKPEVAPEVTMSCEPCKLKDDTGLESVDGWRITISDNGIGFEQDYADKIFEIFQRLHGRLEYEGTGVGLAICRKIVERHNGTIRAESTAGEGATFIVEIPARQASSEAEEHPRREAKVAEQAADQTTHDAKVKPDSEGPGKTSVTPESDDWANTSKKKAVA